MGSKNSLEQLYAEFTPIGLGIMEYYVQKFSELAMDSSLNLMKEMLKEEYHEEMAISLKDHLAKFSAGLPEKLNLTFFHALLAIVSGRIQDFGNFEQGLALLLRETLLKK